MSNPKLATLYIYIISTVAAPQLTNVVLASFRNGTFELSLQYDQQVGRHACSIYTYKHIGQLSRIHCEEAKEGFRQREYIHWLYSIFYNSLCFIYLILILCCATNSCSCFPLYILLRQKLSMDTLV